MAGKSAVAPLASSRYRRELKRYIPALSFHGSSEMTVTDFGSTVNANLPPSILAEIGLGTTVSGAANVFMLSTAEAVRVSAFADLIVIAGNLRIDINRLFRIKVGDFEPKLAGRVPGGEGIHTRQVDRALRCKCRR